MDQLIDRATAMTVPCDDCKAPADSRCTYVDYQGKTQLLEMFPAHHKRLKKAKAAQQEANS